MIWYIPMLCISLLFSELYKKTSKYKTLFLCSSALPFILISGFRFDVGTDYMYRYTPDFNWMAQGNDPKNIEIGFKLLMRCILFFTNHVQVLFFITSLFTLSIIFYMMFKETKNPTVSILIFFFGGYFFNSMNILRQYMAMSLLIVAFYFMIKKEIWKWFLCIILATLFHSTAMIFLLSYIPYYFNFDIKKFVMVVVILFLVGILVKPILLMLIEMTRFEVYLRGEYARYLQGDFQFIQSLLMMLLSIIYIFIYYKNEDKLMNNFKAKGYICLQLLALLFASYTVSMYISTRFVVFFSIFSIFGLSLLWEYVQDKKQKTYIGLILSCLFLGSFSYLYLKNNVDEVFPYKYRFVYNYIQNERS